jgi:hypothetical protein
MTCFRAIIALAANCLPLLGIPLASPAVALSPVKFLSGLFSRRLAASLLLATAAFGADADVKELVEQNRVLADQVRAQQKQIDELRSRLDHMNGAEAPAPVAVSEPGRVLRLSGEVGVGYFDTGSDGGIPNSEFRVDDARLFVEAPVWKNVYFYGALEITTREANDEYFHVGELYVDIEDVWRLDRNYTLSLRAGRMNLPFGEEYLVRNVMDNPLVSHSLSDIWGIDEGVQVYGQLGPLRYNLAVQNGGYATMRDFNSDKSVVARIGFDPTPQLSLSASAMRTGDLTSAGDELSAAWFGNAFFRTIGPPGAATVFDVKLAEVDAAYRWKTGHLKANYGWANYEDNNPTADYSRDITYYSVEGLQYLTARVFGAARYSAIDAPHGYPLAGQGNAGKYFYNPYGPLTKDLQRLSVGLGYRFSDPFIWKVEYSWENGHLVNGTKRDNEDMFSSLLGVRF